MRKILLLLILFTYGCAQGTKGDYYNAIDLKSVSNTIERLGELAGQTSIHNGEVTIQSNLYDVWSVGEELLVLSNAEQSVVSLNVQKLDADEVKSLLNDFEVPVTDAVKEVIDEDDRTLDPDDELYLEFDTKSSEGEKTIVTIERNFDVPELGTVYKNFNVTIYFDKILGEIEKSKLLK